MVVSNMSSIKFLLFAESIAFYHDTVYQYVSQHYGSVWFFYCVNNL
jgi:hypothetical protein